VLAHRARLLGQTDASRLLAGLRRPVLYLHATQDRLLGRRGVNQVKRCLPSARIAELPGPHFILQACPVQAAERIATFRGRLQQGDGEGDPP